MYVLNLYFVFFVVVVCCARLVWALWASELKMKGVVCRLASGCLPTPAQEIDTFPAAFVELCYLLAPNQLLLYTLIFRNDGWYTVSRSRQTHSSCFSWKRNLLLSLSQTLLSDKAVRESCPNISKVLKRVSHPGADCFDICFSLFFLCTWMLWKSN